MASISRVNNSCQEVCRRANFRHFSNRTVYIWNADSSTLQIATDDHGAVGTGGAIPVVTIASYAPQPQPIHIANAVYVVDEPRPVLVEAHRGISQYAVQPQGRYAPQANYTPQAIYTPQQGPAYGNGAFAVHPQ